MNRQEEISKHLAVLNTTWQRYARAVDQQLDTVPMDALNHDFIIAQEGLAEAGIEEKMLAYDPTTMTFSLPTHDHLD